MNRVLRIPVLFALLAAAALRHAHAQAATPTPAQPLPAQMPRPTNVSASAPQLTSKAAAPSGSLRPTAPANPSNQIAKQSAQTKIVRVYRGDNYFDAVLAGELRPMLTRNSSARPPGTETSGPVDWLRSILRPGDGSQKKADQNTAGGTGRP